MFGQAKLFISSYGCEEQGGGISPTSHTAYSGKDLSSRMDDYFPR